MRDHHGLVNGLLQTLPEQNPVTAKNGLPAGLEANRPGRPDQLETSSVYRAVLGT